MKKISYKNTVTIQEVPYSGAIVEPPPNSEGLGGFGSYVLPGDSAIPMEDDEEGVLMSDPSNKNHKDPYDEISKKLIDLADSLDEKGEYKLASFSDFLINKIAEVKALDYERLLKELLVKINESDLVGKKEALMLIAKTYNNKFLELSSDGSIGKAHREAYMAASLKAEDYVK